MTDKELMIQKIILAITDDCNIPTLELIKKVTDSIPEFTVSKMDTTLPSTGDGSATKMIMEKFYQSKFNSGMSMKSLGIYTMAVRDLCNVAHKEITLCDYQDINNYLTWCKVVKNCTPSTIKSKRNYISSVFNFMCVRKYINENPMDMVDKIKAPYIKEDALSIKDIEVIKLYLEQNNTPRNIRLMAMVYFLLDTGVRVSELCNIKVNDIDWTNKKVTIIGKGTKQRTIYFSDRTVVRLEDYFTKVRDDIVSSSIGWKSNKDAYLFTKLRGRIYDKLGPKLIQDEFKELSSKLNMHLHPHLFRRTYCTFMMQQNIPVSLIAELMGHSDINTTDRYVSISEEKKKMLLAVLN